MGTYRSKKMLKKDKSNSNLKASTFSSVSTIKSLGKKLLTSKSFDHNDVNKNVKPIKMLKKRSTVPAVSATESKTQNISTNTAKPISSSVTSARRSKMNESRNNSVNERKMVYNPYGVMSSSINNSSSASGSYMSKNLSSNFSMGYNSPGSINSSSLSRRDPSLHLHEGSQSIRILQLPIASPNDYLPKEFQQKSIQLYDNFKFETNNKSLGSGGSADVKKVVTKGAKAKHYAFKRLNLIYQETDEQYYKRCSKEYIIGRHLNSIKGCGSMNIIGIYQLCKIPTTTKSVRGWGYIMELAKYDLFHLMTRTGWKSVDVSEKYCIFKQIANGVKFMHDNGISHRDLKPENVLLCENGICKITDFGISSWAYNDPKDPESGIKMCCGMIGSPPYAPPEVMMWDSKKSYSKELQNPYNPFLIDTYSLGIILMTLLNNVIPFIESCDKDSKFRDYELAYESYFKYENRLFRKKGIYKLGPGPEYMFARMFNDREMSRIAWRLADPCAATRYNMDDLFNDPRFQKIEMCMDPFDEIIYKYPEPELLYSSLEENRISNIDSKTNTVVVSTENHTSRSMISIAESPKGMEEKPTCSLLTKMLWDSNSSVSSTISSTRNYDEMNISTSFSSSSSSSSSPSPASPTISLGKDTDLFTLEEEETEEANNKDVSDRDIKSIVSNETITRKTVDKSSDRMKINESSRQRRRRMVVHHHLQVVNSVSSMNSPIFSNSMPSSIMSSVGSSSFRKW